MADPAKRCDDRCGCAVPCPGGVSCRCTAASAGREERHTTCACGEHCSCNPCTCGRVGTATGAGRAACACGPACTCATCAA